MIFEDKLIEFEKVGFPINEVEGVAYGQVKTLHEIIKHKTHV